MCHTKNTFYGAPFINENDLYKYSNELIDLESLEKISFLRNSQEAQEVLKNLYEDETAAIICSLNGQCPECLTSMKLTVWVHFEVHKHNQDSSVNIEIINYQILDGDYISISCTPGFYRGVDIASGLHHLYMRWWYLKGEISVICPFIDKDGLQYFDDIGVHILKTNNCRLYTTNHQNPFKRIIFRNRQDGDDFQKTTITKLIQEFLEENCHVENNDWESLRVGEPGSGIKFVMNNSLVKVNTKWEKQNFPENKHHASASYFHGKLYGALLTDKAEMVITSYNYSNRETLQLESATLVETSRENLIHQINKFENDGYMTQELVELNL
jgi:hypothetical protein